MRPRHSDADLLELAAAGSAPAFASLLHRHRDVLQRGVVRAERPEDAAVATVVATMRDLRRGRLRAELLRDRLAEHVESSVVADRGRPGVERLLPPEWFDRTWVRVEARWPSGRRPFRAPRWTWHVVGAVLLAASGSVGTFLVVTAEVSTEVISELVAEAVEDGGTPAPAPPRPVDPPPETESPELFDDVELGDLPSYDLTGGGTMDRPDGGATVAPPPGTDPGADGDAADAEGAED